MQVILDSSFVRPGSAPVWGGKKGEFRDWTKQPGDVSVTSRAQQNMSAVEPYRFEPERAPEEKQAPGPGCSKDGQRYLPVKSLSSG